MRQVNRCATWHRATGARGGSEQIVSNPVRDLIIALLVSQYSLHGVQGGAGSNPAVSIV
jgi:hypothetical protein